MKPQRAIRTDLALENREMLRDERESEDINGVEIDVEKDGKLGVTVTWVRITNEEGAAAMGKPVGNYITLESAALKGNDIETHEEIAKILARKLGNLHRLPKDGMILVVGLGNWKVTPDALGPKVCAKMLVTRHLGDQTPEAIKALVRPVSALSPGVMGITGIETGEIVKGVAEKIKPDLIIAIDALAARRASRINATVQISDGGVNPGSGVGNRRMALTRETLGVPVIAIGVPTVVDAATLVNDTMDHMIDAMKEVLPRGEVFYEMLSEMREEERYGLIRELLDPYEENMFVTPKDVDSVINRLAGIIANALNIALHPGITTEDVNRYLL
ncbi:MAG: GPR endopeptidase [Clostridiales bacterium]|jgi:spore protease|nr:GPR endopeptidase [Clostridiales bacterium]